MAKPVLPEPYGCEPTNWKEWLSHLESVAVVNKWETEAEKMKSSGSLNRKGAHCLMKLSDAAREKTTQTASEALNREEASAVADVAKVDDDLRRTLQTLNERLHRLEMTVNSGDENARPSVSGYYLHIECLVDTGAALSLLRGDVWTKIATSGPTPPLQEWIGQALAGVNGNKLLVRGYTRIPVSCTESELPPLSEVDLTSSHIEKVTRQIQGSAGPGGTDAGHWKDFLLHYGAHSARLRDSLAELARRLASSIVEWSDIKALMSSHLESLDKCPGVRPIVIGELTRHITCKAMAMATRDDIADLCEVDRYAQDLREALREQSMQ
ncbi:hypothetical protein EMCRGX_G016288 [Ephydatia muelleri]